MPFKAKKPQKYDKTKISTITVPSLLSLIHSSLFTLPHTPRRISSARADIICEAYIINTAKYLYHSSAEHRRRE